MQPFSHTHYDVTSHPGKQVVIGIARRDFRTNATPLRGCGRIATKVPAHEG
jgi:hypothetical protein